MFEYRITKYNPIFRVNGIYTRDDWTSICDVGKKYNGCTLTTDECATVMSNYVNCIMEIIATAQVPEFTVSDVEVYNIKYKRKFRLKNGEVVSQQRLRYIIMGCLEEKVWCHLSSKNAYIHFGYDLYVYVGCELDHSSIEHICSKYGLFGEPFTSPYKES